MGPRAQKGVRKLERSVGSHVPRVLPGKLLGAGHPTVAGYYLDSEHAPLHFSFSPTAFKQMTHCFPTSSRELRGRRQTVRLWAMIYLAL